MSSSFITWLELRQKQVMTRTSRLYATIHTDVFVLLIHFYLEKRMTMNVSMESPCAGRTIIDIRQTAVKHKHITKYMPAVHALAGFDTVSYNMFGIGKAAAALKLLMSGHHVPHQTRSTESR